MHAFGRRWVLLGWTVVAARMMSAHVGGEETPWKGEGGAGALQQQHCASQLSHSSKKTPSKKKTQQHTLRKTS